MPTLAHKIRLDPPGDQIQYFKQASGTARFVWNWALAEWNRQYEAGQKPQAAALKKQCNAINYPAFPWLRAIHRDGHARPFADLADAWYRCFTGQNDRPVLKKKRKTPDSFSIANDKLPIVGRRVKLAQIGWVRWREPLRFSGKIFGARLVREAEQGFLSVPDSRYYRTRTGHGIPGVDVGVQMFAPRSTGEKITGPQAHRRALRRLNIRQRALTRKMPAAKAHMGVTPRDPLSTGTRLPRRGKGIKAQSRVARTHLRLVDIRRDCLHKTSPHLCRANQAVGIERLSVKGMMANHRLARSSAEQGLGQFFALLKYQARRYEVRLVEADRWFPSSKGCSTPGCGCLKTDRTLKDRTWIGPGCGVSHDRDVNAAINLQGLATRTALPVATRPARAATVLSPDNIDGKVTPVRDEATPAGHVSAASGQEEFDDHHRSPNL